MSERHKPAHLEEMLTALVRQEGPPDGIVTSWVVVCEVIEGTSGDLSLMTLCDPTQPYWHHRGMLEHAVIPSECEDD